MNKLLRLTDFQHGSAPLTYHGVPLFKGRAKKRYLTPIADRIITKLSSWIGSYLSMVGRITLVKSIIHGMVTYSINVYSRTISILKKVESACGNFIWVGCINSKKICTVSWKNLCQPYSNGGLGLRSLIILNDVANLQFLGDMINKHDDIAILLRNCILIPHGFITHHIFSTIWSIIKVEVPNLFLNSSWSLGSGRMIRFWKDSWDGDPLINNTYLDFVMQK